MNRELVSVIIPVFNAHNTLRTAIESVLNQSYASIELIIIDGKSTDGSWEIIQSFKDKIAYSTSAEDDGIYDAMNKGIDKSSGEWIFLMGADDAFATSHIVQEVMEKREDHVKLIFGNAENVGVEHIKVPAVHQSALHSGILWRNTIHQQSAFYHRDIFKDFRFHSQYKILADYHLHLKLYFDKIPFQYIDCTVTKCNATGLSKKFNMALYMEEWKMKKNRDLAYPTLTRFIQLPWVLLKFFYKKVTA